MHNVGIYYFPKINNTVFKVKNIAPNGKRIRIFTYPINNGKERDLLAIPGISEADIRHSLLKGELNIKLRTNEIIVTESNIDLLQFSSQHKSFLKSSGITKGLEITADQFDNHESLRQLIHFIDDGPASGFASGAYKEILPVGDPFWTQAIWWESSAKLKKIIELTLTRDGNQNPILEVWKMYNSDQTVVATVTDTIAYSNSIEINRTRVIS